MIKLLSLNIYDARSPCFTLSLRLFNNTNLCCSKYTISNFPTRLHYSTYVVVGMFRLRQGKYRFVDVRIEFFTHGLELDHMESLQAAVHYVGCHIHTFLDLLELDLQFI